MELLKNKSGLLYWDTVYTCTKNKEKDKWRTKVWESTNSYCFLPEISGKKQRAYWNGVHSAEKLLYWPRLDTSFGSRVRRIRLVGKS